MPLTAKPKKPAGPHLPTAAGAAVSPTAPETRGERPGALAALLLVVLSCSVTQSY